MKTSRFSVLIDFMRKIPLMKNAISSGVYENGNRWINFSLDIHNKLTFIHLLNSSCPKPNSFSLF